MKLGEIKMQALSLMYPDEVIRYDESDDGEICDAVYRLKNNPNFEGVLESCVGAINRAFAHIESLGLSTKKCVDLALSTLERSGDGRVKIPTERDLYSVERVLCHKNGKSYACGFELIDGVIYADYMSKGVYTVVYKTKIARVKRTTSDTYQVELPFGICDAIPYFVMAELFSGESEERAQEARRIFDLALERAGKHIGGCHECFQIIYSVVEQ